MKTKHFFFAALLCCLGLGASLQAHAESWRVNNNSKARADFADLNAAMVSDKVNDGDTLYLDKGTVIANAQTISKTVTVIGPGYFIGENDADEAKLTGGLNIESDEVKVTGVHTASINIRALEVAIERCRVDGFISGEGNYDNDYASIRSCFIYGRILGGGDQNASEWEILNNIIVGVHTEYRIANISDATISNNIILSLYGTSNYVYALNGIYNSTIKNNIIHHAASDARTIASYENSYNNIITNNVLSGFDATTTYPNNTIVKDRSAIIMGTGEYTAELFYELVSGSKAIGAADDGGDCGCWSGPYPYVKHGYPLHIPRFESVSVPSQPDASGSLKVQLKVVNQNQ